MYCNNTLTFHNFLQTTKLSKRYVHSPAIKFPDITIIPEYDHVPDINPPEYQTKKLSHLKEKILFMTAYLNFKKPIKLQYLSDLHLEYRKNIPYIPIVGDMLALCGDIGHPIDPKYKDYLKQCSNNYEQVFLLSGNHEYWNNGSSCPMGIDEIDELIEDITSKFPNVHFLNKNSFQLDHNTTIIGATLWSKILNKPMRKMGDDVHIFKNNKIIDSQEFYNLHEDHKLWLEDEIRDAKNRDNKVIVLTHHLPSYRMIIPYYNSPPYSYYQDRFASHIDDLIKEPVIYWICGHSHCQHTIHINGIPCSINAVGYPSNYNEKQLNNNRFAKYIELE
jgi:predicted MPP superfamily phosphohydrolase